MKMYCKDNTPWITGRINTNESSFYFQAHSLCAILKKRVKNEKKENNINKNKYGISELLIKD